MHTVKTDRVMLMRKPQVLSATGASNSTLYADIGRELFVRPVKIGPRAAAWPSNEVDAVVTARIGGATDEQLRALVQRLHLQRKTDAVEVLAGVAA